MNIIEASTLLKDTSNTVGGLSNYMINMAENWNVFKAQLSNIRQAAEVEGSNISKQQYNAFVDLYNELCSAMSQHTASFEVFEKL